MTSDLGQKDKMSSDSKSSSENVLSSLKVLLHKLNLSESEEVIDKCYETYITNLKEFCKGADGKDLINLDKALDIEERNCDKYMPLKREFLGIYLFFSSLEAKEEMRLYHKSKLLPHEMLFEL